VAAAARKASSKVIDCHLMITPVDPYIQAFAKAGADIITIHAEAGPHLHRSLQTIRAEGKKAGVAINPATPVSAVAHVIGDIDLLLVMTVHPGFGGQSFRADQMEKVKRARSLSDKIDVAVDGGINAETAQLSIQNGANVLVAGTSIFHAPDYAKAIRDLRVITR
jgi:ribulose-phosphate 3-epimerase